MRPVLIENPYKVEAFNYSWQNIREYTDTLINRFPSNYRLAYFNDYYQKLFLLVNTDFYTLDMAGTQILIILKIDNSKSFGLYTFEIKSYYGNISSKEDIDKGWSSLKNISSYLKLFEA